MTQTGSFRSGTAGWVYAPWRGSFFPTGLVQKKELAFAAGKLGTIEINATFRGPQKPESFARWASETPPDFVFSVKGPQLITHIRRLKNCWQDLANFFASGPLALGDRLGPFVWQLPPNLAYDPDSMAGFLAQLPHALDAYLALAGEADTGKAPPFVDAKGVTKIRHAIEMRHPSFHTSEVDELLSRHNVARVISDTMADPRRSLTADFAYCRLQGPARPDATGYDAEDIAALASTMKPWLAAGHDVFAYFVHEDKLHAPANAMALAAALGKAPPGP